MYISISNCSYTPRIFAGTRTYADASSYEGQWKASRQNGHGVQTWPDGTTYEGDFHEVESRGPYATVLQNTFRIFLAKKMARERRKPKLTPASLTSICLDCIALCIKTHPQKFTAAKIKTQVPVHMRYLLAEAFINRHGEGLSEKFKEIVPVIAWNDDLEEIAFTQARPTIPDLRMLDYFLRSCQKLKTVSLAWNKFGTDKPALNSEKPMTSGDDETDGEDAVVSNSGAGSIAMLIQANETITSLDLSWGGLGVGGLQVLCSILHENDRIKKLGLAGNKCFKEGAIHVRTSATGT